MLACLLAALQDKQGQYKLQYKVRQVVWENEARNTKVVGHMPDLDRVPESRGAQGLFDKIMENLTAGADIPKKIAKAREALQNTPRNSTINQRGPRTTKIRSETAVDRLRKKLDRVLVPPPPQPAPVDTKAMQRKSSRQVATVKKQAADSSADAKQQQASFLAAQPSTGAGPSEPYPSPPGTQQTQASSPSGTLYPSPPGTADSSMQRPGTSGGRSGAGDVSSRRRRSRRTTDADGLDDLGGGGKMSRRLMKAQEAMYLDGSGPPRSKLTSTIRLSVRQVQSAHAGDRPPARLAR